MDKDVFKRISASNDTHWWFRSRRDIFKNLLKKINLNEPEILDYGSGGSKWDESGFDKFEYDLLSL